MTHATYWPIRNCLPTLLLNAVCWLRVCELTTENHTWKLSAFIVHKFACARVRVLYTQKSIHFGRLFHFWTWIILRYPFFSNAQTHLVLDILCSAVNHRKTATFSITMTLFQKVAFVFKRHKQRNTAEEKKWKRCKKYEYKKSNAKTKREAKKVITEVRTDFETVLTEKCTTNK